MSYITVILKIQLPQPYITFKTKASLVVDVLLLAQFNDSMALYYR